VTLWTQARACGPRPNGRTRALSLGDAFDSILAGTPLASGAVVMGTGIVSIALRLDRHETVSRVLLVIAAASWVALALAIASRWRRDPVRLRQEARSPTALTGVAGTAVIGTRLVLLGWNRAGAAMLATACLAWLAVLGPILTSWVTPTDGSSLLLAVSTQSLAVLSATLGAREHAAWLVHAGLALLLLGLAFYAFVIARFDHTQLTTGRGDHWISGGALAISTLAAAQITLAHQPTALSGALEPTTIVLWALTIAWLPALLIGEALRPRTTYHLRRWSTVFPIGMYAACSFPVGSLAHAPAITQFARVWMWGALAVWLIVSLAMARRWRELLPRPQTS
jgi:tellurite resistance protein TehA-like permease